VGFRFEIGWLYDKIGKSRRPGNTGISVFSRLSIFGQDVLPAVITCLFRDFEILHKGPHTTHDFCLLLFCGKMAKDEVGYTMMLPSFTLQYYR
jgi:hypothetical protein